MLLESVRSLKAELSAEAAEMEVLKAPDEAAMRAFHAATEPPMPAGVALGVSLAENGEHLLAVRTEDPEEAARIDARASGEADVRILKVIKRTTPAYLQSTRRPLEPGVQIGMRDRDFVGTLGCFVRDNATRRLCLLSNAHVIADEGLGQVGHQIGQPFGSTTQLVSVLLRFAPLSATAPNLVDAAVATLDPAVEALTQFDGAIAPTPLVGARDVTAADLGLEVLKVGRTTGAQKGRITAVEIDGLPVGYDRGVLRFNDQIEISGGPTTDFSAAGDSGSLIVGRNGDVLALLFAGGRDSSGEDRTYGSRMTNVLSALGVSLA